MVIKSLTITEDAYDALKAMKRGDESFSDTVIRITRNRALVVERMFGALKMSEKEADELVKNIKKRREESDREYRKRRERLNRAWTDGNS